jgi:hypothetical protein
MPGYWMDETGVLLRPAVEAYLSGCNMAPIEIAVMRAYLRQWIMDPVWDANPHADDLEHACLTQLRTEVDGLTSRAAIASWLPKAEAFGIDPL